MGDDRMASMDERRWKRDHHGDRWSEDAEDRIEWHADQTRRWVRILTVVAIGYIAWDVTVRVLM